MSCRKSGHFSGVPFCPVPDISDVDFSFKDYNKKEVPIGTNILDVLTMFGAASSKREAREFTANGAVSINGNKITDINYLITESDFLNNTHIIIKRGKKNYYLGVKGDVL